ncbi:MAG: hypothetical protein FJY77_03800 [Candidatus Altiarchaeales archaeon]|nr:hypothetical protein [Candidatus Altiarchaeales archaeon]
MKAKTLTAILLLLLSQNALSIGISPAGASFNNMARGGYGEKVLVLSNAGDSDLLVAAKLEGEAAPWITLQPNLINNTLGKKSTLPFKVKIMLPPQISVGTYSATLLISTLNMEGASTGGGSGAKFMPGVIVPIKVDITGEELMDYDITGFTVSDAEIDEAVDYTVQIKNKGNVQIIPNITVEILNQDKSTTLKTGEVDMAPILPTTEEMIRGSINSEGLKTGKYWLKITGYLRGKVLTKKEVDFKILETGTISIEGVLSDLIVARKAAPGDKIKITVYFNNTCLKVLQAKSSCEIFKAGKLLDTVESSQLRVDPGVAGELVSYYTLSDMGQYELKCRAYYHNKQTDMVERIVTVEPESQVDYMAYLIYALIVLTTIILAYTIYSRYKRR